MEIECKTATRAIILKFVIMTVLIQTLSAVIFIFADKEDTGPALVLELGWILFVLPSLCNLFWKCPICGKRTLSVVSRCGGTRYTMYDADCRHCKRQFDITRDREERKTSYKTIDDKSQYGTPITPIWKGDKKEKD